MKTIIYFLILVLAVRSTLVSAEFACSSEISYKWREISGEKEKGGAKGAEAVIYFSSVQETGADEAAAKKALEESTVREKVKASDACKRLHENLAGCMSAKFASLANTLQNASFTARKQIEDAVVADCRGQQGTCLEIIASDPKCAEIKKESAEDEKKEAGKKDEKGKGKKK